MLSLATFSSALVLSLGTLAAAGNHESFKRHHVGPARLDQNHTLSKRFDNARFSFYETGMGACGKYNNDGDFVSLPCNFFGVAELKPTMNLRSSQ